MVAYSFNAIFEDQVARLLKLQTLRADRTRHARPGEPVFGVAYAWFWIGKSWHRLGLRKWGR